MTARRDKSAKVKTKVSKRRVPILLVTGLSGSGKSTAVAALEDVGYFCVDNLPFALLDTFLALVSTSRQITKTAIVMDARDPRFPKAVPEIMHTFRRTGLPVEVLFLDAADDTLVRRFSETRRRHPMEGRGGVAQAVARERELLRELGEAASVRVDTSNLNVHELKHFIVREFGKNTRTGGEMRVRVLSFGFRYGVPAEADLVFDVRFLPNPHFAPGLRNKTGRNKDVAKMALGHRMGARFLKKVKDLTMFLLPLYQAEGKVYLTIAVGCTGGKHRSVATVEDLARSFEAKGYQVELAHRDINRS